jgi:hypothetical protein
MGAARRIYAPGVQRPLWTRLSLIILLAVLVLGQITVLPTGAGLLTVTGGTSTLATILLVVLCVAAILFGPWLLFTRIAAWLEQEPEEEVVPSVRRNEAAPPPMDTGAANLTDEDILLMQEDSLVPREEVLRALAIASQRSGAAWVALELLKREAIALLGVILMLGGIIAPCALMRGQPRDELLDILGMACHLGFPLGVSVCLASFTRHSGRTFGSTLARIVFRGFAFAAMEFGLLTLFAKHLVGGMMSRLLEARQFASSQGLTTKGEEAFLMVMGVILVALGLLMLLASFEPWRKEDRGLL